MKFLVVIIISLIISLTSSVYSQITFKFDSLSRIQGCANELLQKSSKDWRYEIRVEIQIDSIPKYEEFDILNYSKFIRISFYKYPSDNIYIDEICDDVIITNKTPKQPIEYYCVEGAIIIDYWVERSIISAILKNIIVRNKFGEIIQLPLETFQKLKIGWVGG